MAARNRRWKRPAVLRTFLKTTKRRKSRRDGFSLLETSSDHVEENEIILDEMDDPSGTSGFNLDELDEDPAGTSIGVTNSSNRRRLSNNALLKNQYDEWTRLLPVFVDMAVDSLWLNDAVCVMCQQTDACTRCLDCGPTSHYCQTCCQTEHTNKNVYHTPEWFSRCRFVPAPLNIVFDIDHPCLSTYREGLTVIALNRQHHVTVVYCSCHTRVERLIELRLWPATPFTPHLAFRFELMELIHSLVLECQVSLHDACKLVNVMSFVHQRQDKKIYKLLTNSFPYYRAYRNLLDENVFYKTTKCPACPLDSQDPIFLAVDANFRLCRKSKAATSRSFDRLILNGHFLDQKNVDKYVSSCSSLSDDVSSCSQFRAGDILRSKKRYKALDETAVLGAICRHDIPLKMLSLKHGERLGYADILLREIKKIVSEAPINLSYDIGCKLVSHWKTAPLELENFLSHFNVAVPIFHSYAHNAKCQYQYSPRNKKGYGLCDGENIERLWSYLGKFCKMTKEMSSSNRMDVLTDALNHYSCQKIDKIGISLVERMRRALKIIKSTDLHSLVNAFGVEVDIVDMIEQFEEEEEARLSATYHNPVLDDWKIYYVEKLENLKTLTTSWVNAISGININNETIALTAQHLIRLELSLCDIESQHSITSRWTPDSDGYKGIVAARNTNTRQKLKSEMNGLVKERIFYLNTIANHVGGQKQANRVSRLISNTTSKIAKLLSEYKSLLLFNEYEQSFSVPDVCDLKSNFWTTCDHSRYSIRQASEIPAETK